MFAHPMVTLISIAPFLFITETIMDTDSADDRVLPTYILA